VSNHAQPLLTERRSVTIEIMERLAGCPAHSGHMPITGRWPVWTLVQQGNAREQMLSAEKWPQRRRDEWLEQFQEKCVAVFRPELRKNNSIERSGDSVKRVTALKYGSRRRRRAPQSLRCKTAPLWKRHLKTELL